MPSKDNLLKYIELKGDKKSEFYKKTGLSNGFLDKNDNISSDTIEIIISKYADLSLEYLITGNGEMLKSGTSNPSEPTKEDRLLLINESQQRTIEELTGIVKTLTSK